ncbi:amidohydrolase, partial [Streptomyces varsoviensis]
MTTPRTGPADALPNGIVDAHHHVWDLTVRDQDWIAGDRMAPLRRNFAAADLRPEAAA